MTELGQELRADEVVYALLSYAKENVDDYGTEGVSWMARYASLDQLRLFGYKLVLGAINKPERLCTWQGGVVRVQGKYRTWWYAGIRITYQEYLSRLASVRSNEFACLVGAYQEGCKLAVFGHSIIPLLYDGGDI